MRKHDVRKWLHAILDLLPVILIPVFMIYSHRHEINDGSIEVPQNRVVDFNQLVQNGDFENSSKWLYYTNLSTFSVDNNVGILTSTTDDSGNTNISIRQELSHSLLGHQCLIRFEAANSNGNSVRLRNPFIQSSSVAVTSSFQKFTFAGVANADFTNLLRIQVVSANVGNVTYFKYVQLFDLTQMFGSGNEPSSSDFNNLYPQSYYPYVESHTELLQVGSITYNDTDIMSQFTYQLYNSVDKYFNMGNVFHLNEVYDWFNLNIFNGQAPIYIFIVYQIVLYELIMDLLMLLYALFMWFIDMIEKLMEKPLNSIK